jgi:hypothetical protein
MAELSFVQLDNSFYATTPDRAVKVKAAWKERRATAPPVKVPPVQAKKNGDASKDALQKK